jgi:hypothetical protein
MSSFGALTSFYLILSVTPLYAMSAGAGSAEAGIVTGCAVHDRAAARDVPRAAAMSASTDLL